MEVTVASERILVLTEQLSFDQAQAKAWDKKIDAFGTINKLGSFLTRPKDDDFELVYKEYRYEPFWHVVANAHYIYDRNTTYQIPVSGSEVQDVTSLQTDFKVTNGHIHLSALEHCEQTENEEVLIDGVSGKNNPGLKRYLAMPAKTVEGKLEETVAKDAILIPPQARISAIMRDALAKMIKGIQADKIHEETVKVDCVDLYYRPVYAFKYLWKSKAKEAIAEVDGLTGDVGTGVRTFNEYVGKVLDKNFLFDLGADAAGMFIPGGSIAVKVAKKYIDLKDK